jgi:hypothetical protein
LRAAHARPLLVARAVPMVNWPGLTAAMCSVLWGGSVTCTLRTHGGPDVTRKWPWEVESSVGGFKHGSAVLRLRIQGGCTAGIPGRWERWPLDVVAGQVIAVPWQRRPAG